jgi:NAD(P)H-flavin reductase
MQTISSKLLEAKKLTDDVFHYEFELTEPVDFEPGQFFMLKVPGLEKPVNRSYSVASPPKLKGRFALCIKLVPGGKASEYLRSAKIGDEMEFMCPFGHFKLKDVDKDIVMVSTGTGLAPFMSMLPVLFERGFKRPINLLFGVRTAEDLFYVDQLRKWEEEHPNFKATLTLSRPSEGWNGETGRVTSHLEAMEIDPEQSMVYICGNGQMVKDVKNMMVERGLPREGIALEQFTPA